MANELATQAQGAVANLNEITQYIVVNIAEEQFGIDIKFIDNIVRMQSITRVPKVAHYLKGVINLRGEVIPVMSLRLKMDLPEDEITKHTRIIIIKIQHESIGIIVDSVKEVVNIPASNIEKLGYDNREDRQIYVNGIGKMDGGSLISLLDVNAVLQEC